MELFKLFGTIAIDNAEANEALDDTGDKAKETGKNIKETGDDAEKSESKFSTSFQKMGSAAAKVGKAIAAGLAVASAAVVKIGKDAISAYGDYEQLVGGVETLFKDSSDTVIQNAANAYKTAGMSANAYMETVTSFSASLLQSLGGDTVKAAEKADTAITDMSDNANKMGTSMEAIQNAYQGFAKQNYTMLDNLKLGYGGTKEEMERLLEDASKISGIKYDISSFSDITDAIHIVQTEMGITGTTAKEAATTIQGSISSMKGAWQNLLTGLADGNQDIGGLITNVFNSMVTVADNIIPKIQQVLQTLPNLITQLVPKLISKVSEVIDVLLPSVVDGAVSLLNAVVGVLPQLLQALMNALPSIISGIEKVFFAIVDALPSLMQTICDALPVLIPQLVEALVNMIVYLCENLMTIIQPLLDNLPAIIIAIVDALMNNLPALIEGCIQLVIGIVQAIPQIILALIEALPTIITSIVAGLFQALPTLIMGIIQLIGEIGKAIWAILKGFFSSLGKFFSGLWESIKTIFQPVIDFFKNIFQGAWDGIKNIWNAVSGFFSGIWNGIKNIFSGVGNFFKNIFQGAWDGIKNIWNAVSGFFSGIWNGIKNIFSGVGNFFKNIFQGAYNGITGIFSKIGGFFKDVFGALGNIIKAPVNLVIKGLNVLIGGLNKVGFDVPDWVPVIGGKRFGFNIPKIPLLAKGTVVENGAQPAIIGEDGAEAVVPLEKHTGWIKNVARQLHEFSLETTANISDVLPDNYGKTLEYQQQQVSVLDIVADKLNTLIDVLAEYFPEFAELMRNKQLVLDTGVLVGEIAPDMDKALGNIYKKKGRGNE